jgi:vacuolar-type H+-ATPase subunit I/STV1
MRLALIVMISTVLLRALPAPQAEDPGVLRARLNIQRLQALVDAGAVPRSQLEQAQDNLSDAQDLAVLRRTMSITDLTEEQANQMVTAAQHRLERRQKQLEKMQDLVKSGIAARNDVQPVAEQVDFAHSEYDLAVSRAKLSQELAEMARDEQIRQSQRDQAAAAGARESARFDGNGVFTPSEFQQVSTAYERRFAKALPVSALGETAVHRALGFDHRGRVDVAVSPDTPEGIWLRQYLEARRIPYFAFWHAAAGRATGAHIHIGPESTRLSAVAD